MDTQRTMNSGYTNNPRDEMLKYVPRTARRVLDVGCAAGAFAARVKERNRAEVWGIDPNAEAVAIAKERLDAAIARPFDETSTLPDHHFDVIIFNDVLEHFANPERALRLCHEKLVPGGVVVCSIPNVRHIDNLEHVLLERDWRYEEFGIRDATHLRFFTKKSIVRLFQDAGFAIQLIEGINSQFWDRKKLWRRALFRLFPEWSEDTKFLQFAVVATASAASNVRKT